MLVGCVFAVAGLVCPAIQVVAGLVLVAGAWAAVLGKPMGLGTSWAGLVSAPAAGAEGLHGGGTTFGPFGVWGR